MKNISLVIPVYKPAPQLFNYIQALAHKPFTSILVVDDGSGTEYMCLFRSIARIRKVKVISHAINCGKGAALKSAFHYWLCSFPKDRAILCLDADGQHLLDDVLRMSRQSKQAHDSLILGSRIFHKRANIPWRSKFGNVLTRYLFYFLVGQKLYDTQTGLRLIPRRFVYELLRIKENRYEFELEMLIQTKYHNIPIQEVAIQAVYENNNSTSHFNPFLDSMRIYYVLFRSTLVSATTAILDNLIFVASLNLGLTVAPSQVAARVVSTGYSFCMIRRIVFHSQQNITYCFAKYILLTIVSGFLSYGAILLLVNNFAFSIIYAKVLSETVIYLANFAIQRDFIFNKTTA